MTDFSRLQQVKRRFFAMRNGVIADTYRKAGSPHHIIFGLVLPQLVEIASEFSHDPELARQLWNNRSTRESMLLAPMLLRPEDITVDSALEMINQSPAAETVDILCHRLLRHTPFSLDIAIKASDPELTPICRYAAMRLLWHKIYSDAATVRQLAERELATGEPLTSLPARQILDELDYMQNPG